MTRVSYAHFWSGFNPELSLLTQLIRKYLAEDVEIVQDGDEDVDLAIYSVFPFRNRWEKALRYGQSMFTESAKWDYFDRSDYGFTRRNKGRPRKTLWFTPENLRPPWGIYDAYLSFQKDDFVLGNRYFPFFFWRIDWGFVADETVLGMTPEYLYSSRPSEVRQENVCAFSRSREPMRLKLYDVVGSQFRLEKFGSATGKVIVDKHKKSREYGLQVCPENDLYPGYITEKVPEAWFCGNIPIWHGLDSEGYFNQEALVDLTGMSYSEMVTRLKNLDGKVIERMRSRPILKKLPSLNPTLDLFASLLK